VAKRVRVGAIGCGSFARGTHFPLLKRNPNYEPIIACDIDIERAEQAVSDFGFKRATSNPDEVLHDPEVDIVFIITRHESHADLTIRAARAGKNIFCEKPMGITPEECREVFETVKPSGVKYSIGYNRGLAPLVQKAREILSTRKLPLLIYHRMQNPFPEGTHWLLNEKIGGGRIVGEGCHCIDLFSVLARSEPVRVCAEGGIFTGSKEHHTPDSFSLTLGFEDGSAASLILSSVGSAGIEKESTEIYCEDKAIIITNFQKMVVSSGAVPERMEVTLPEVDKGHARELQLLADAILGDTEPPNGLIQAYRTAIVCFKAVESVLTHRVVKISKDEYGLSG